MRHHKNLKVEVIPLNSHPLFVLNINNELAQEQLIFSFLFSKDYLENLPELNYSFSSKFSCCPCSNSNKSLDFSTKIERHLKNSKSLENFLEKHGFWAKEMNLLKFEDFLQEIRNENNLKIVNPLKSNLTIFTESSKSSQEKIIIIKETSDGIQSEKRLHLIDRLSDNKLGHIELYEAKDNGNKFAVRFFKYPQNEDMKTFMIKSISRLFMKNAELKLKHQNILSYPHRLLRVISNGNKQKLVDVCVLAEYCGNNMEVYLKDHKKITSSQAKSFIRDIYKGVSYLKETKGKDYTHCNLKPSNILINSKKEVKIDYLNFYEIYLNDADTRNSIYMAPELKQETHPIPKEYIKADVFSLGALYYYFLTGKPLFKEGEENKVYLNENFDIPLEEGIDKSSRELLNNMLEFDHNKRISWDDLKDVFSDNENFNRNSSDCSAEEEKKQHQIFPIKNTTIGGLSDSSKSWVIEEETPKISGYLDNLQKFLIFLADFHKCLSKNAFNELLTSDFHILEVFIKKMGMVQIIEVATKIEKNANEDQWKYFCFLTKVFNENIKINYESFALEMKQLGMPILKIIKLHNEKTSFADCESNIKGALSNLANCLKEKKKELQLDEENKKKLEFLSCCLAIFLDLNNNFNDANGLIVRFESYRDSMGFVDSLSNMFLSME